MGLDFFAIRAATRRAKYMTARQCVLRYRHQAGKTGRVTDEVLCALNLIERLVEMPLVKVQDRRRVQVSMWALRLSKCILKGHKLEIDVTKPTLISSRSSEVGFIETFSNNCSFRVLMTFARVADPDIDAPGVFVLPRTRQIFLTKFLERILQVLLVRIEVIFNTSFATSAS